MTLVITRATKQAARYTDAGGRERCSACRFFMPQGTCGRIIGPVSPRGWCRFYSQEAVQRWQPQGAQGQGGSPTLDLTFISGSGTLDPRITFTRASTATYFNSSGTMQTAASGAPRFDYDPVTHAARGLLIEEARTNTLFPSTIGGTWIVAGSVASGGSVTLPDGTTSTTALLYSTDTTNAQRQAQAPSVAAAAATAYTMSAYLRAGPINAHFQINATGGVTSASAAYFDLTNGTAVVGADLLAGATSKSVSIIPVGNGWFRCSFTLTTQAGCTGLGGYVGPCVVVSSTGDNRPYVGVVGQGIYAWGVQIEQGAFPTSYIPTTAATVTRAQEACSIPTTPWYNFNFVSLLFEIYNPVQPSGAVGGFGDGATFGNSLYLASGTQFNRGGISAASSGPLVVGAVNKICGTLNSATIRCCTNAGAIGSAANTGGVAGAVTLLAFGGAPWAVGTGNMNGHIRRVRYWPRVLSDAELQQVTT